MTIITIQRKKVTSKTLIHATKEYKILCMEKKSRTLTKSITWQIIGFVMMAVINYFYIGNFSQGLGLAALLTLIGLVSYYLHERFWASIRWGRQDEVVSTEEQ